MMPAGVGLGIFGDDFLFARLQIQRGQRAGVATPAIGEIHDVARLVEPADAGGERVGLRDFHESRSSPLCRRASAARCCRRASNFEAKRIRKSSSVMKPANSVFFCTSFLSPVENIDAIDIVILRVAIVQADQAISCGKFVADLFDLGPHLLIGAARREVFRFRPREISTA